MTPWSKPQDHISRRRMWLSSATQSSIRHVLAECCRFVASMAVTFENVGSGFVEVVAAYSHQHCNRGRAGTRALNEDSYAVHNVYILNTRAAKCVRDAAFRQIQIVQLAARHDKASLAPEKVPSPR